MDAILTAFIAAGLAEWGDKTMLFAALLAARHGRPGAVLAGLAVAAIAATAIAVAGGILVANLITPRAASLLVAVSLAFAGVAAFIGSPAPDMGGNWRRGGFFAAAFGCFLLEFGDTSQFIAFALAARFDAPLLTGAGAAAGMIAAGIPAVLLGARLKQALPLRPVRYGAGLLFLLAAAVTAVQALRLA